MTYFAILWANISSVPLFARFFLGNTFQFGFHYTIFGYEVWLGEALLSICAVIVIALLCASYSHAPNYIMIIAALTFAVGFTVCAVIALFRHDVTYSFEPMYTEGAGELAQIVRIAVISPWAFIGFENIAHFSEEYSFPVKRVRRILFFSVLITTALYILVSLLSVSAYPQEYGSWLAYVRDMGNLTGIKAVPAFYAAYHYMGQTGIVVLMLSLFGVILTSLIGNMLALSRILFAAGHEGEAPKGLSECNHRGIPAKAFFIIAVISVLIPFIGRTAIGWIVDVTTLGATIIYGLLSYTVHRYAYRKRNRLETWTGAAGMLLMLGFLLMLLIPGLLPFHAMETESYILFIVWSILGLIYFRILIRRDHQREYRSRVIVWIALLMLVLFASMMWVARATENAAEEAVERIYEYHESHPADDSDEAVKEERLTFLAEQADRISGTNVLYTVVTLGLFVLSASIILNNSRETKKLGEQLDEAEKIAELKHSLSSLLDNMPGLNFSKDATTGVYVACNQAFAEYAHKEKPEDVIGLTDADLFDAVTAKHFTDDDKVALSMDKPFIFYEDVLDGEGNHRQLQTTKLNYVDAFGRSCLLGMSQDVTDLVRIRRENDMTKEAYERIRSSGIIYTHIAQTLAKSYTDLYYVNLETEEFIEYLPGTEGNTLTEERRGTDFFDKCKADTERVVHPDDRQLVRTALERKTLIDYLDRNGTFIMTYRLLTEESPLYVTMKVSRMSDDERFIIVGVSDVDEQVRNRRAAERMEEESIAYNRLSALSGEFLCVYIVNPETDRYREYSANTGYALLSIPKEGEDFFGESRIQGQKVIYHEDLPRYLDLFTKEGVMAEMERSGFYSLRYRLVLSGTPTYVQLRAVMVEEKEGARIIIGVTDIDALVRQEEEYEARLSMARKEADIDTLTGIRNRHAYHNAEEKLDQLIEEQRAVAFAVVILDVNDLKKVNDTQGHQAGDQLIRDACGIICGIFSHSAVFRVGGDEFTVIAQEEDYANIDTLVKELDDRNLKAAATGGIVIACGMDRYEGDEAVSRVWERADRKMYEDKKRLKSL